MKGVAPDTAVYTVLGVTVHHPGLHFWGFSLGGHQIGHHRRGGDATAVFFPRLVVSVLCSECHQTGHHLGGGGATTLIIQRVGFLGLVTAQGVTMPAWQR
jgi:hypothetical protein